MSAASGRPRRRGSPLLRRLAGTQAGERIRNTLRGRGAKTASAVVTVLLLFAVARVLSAWTVPVWYSGEKNSPAAVSSGFYALPKDSVDVLFLGGSRAEAAYAPQFLYNEQGITAYTLCAGDQGLRENYFWLQEALRFQGPKAVVLEISTLACDPESEAARKALTYMRWSRVKWGAVRTLSRDPEEGGLLSWMFPGLWFHGRWQELSEEDFDSSAAVQPDGLMGWSGQYTDCSGLSYTPVQLQSDTGAAQTAEAAAADSDGQTVTANGTEPGETEAEDNGLSWLDRIVLLCREKGIHLILTVTPSDDLTEEEHRGLAAAAGDRKLRLLDFGTEGLYRRVGYDFAGDQHDGQHANVSGAQKLTSYLGLVLSQDYGLTSHSSQRWEEQRTAANSRLKETQLKKAGDITSFLANLSTEDYSVFFLTDGSLSLSLSEEDQRTLRNLGIRTDLSALKGRAWYAVPGQENGGAGSSRVFQEAASGETQEVLTAEGLFRRRRSRFTLRCTGEGSAESAQLCIDGVIHTPAEHGLYIVVYDTDRRTVVTEALFSGKEGVRVR